IEPVSGQLLGGGSALVRSQVSNTGGLAAAFQVTQALAGGLTTDDPLTHTISLPVGGAGDFFTLVRLPATSGTATVTGTLTSDGRFLDRSTLDLTVPRSTAAIELDVVAGLRNLALTGADGQRRERAIAKVQAAGGADPAAAIALVLEAIDEVRKITRVDVSANRVEL